MKAQPGLSPTKVNKFDTTYVSKGSGREFTYPAELIVLMPKTKAPRYDFLNLLHLNWCDSKSNKYWLRNNYISSKKIATSEKTFTINLLGEVDSTILG